MHNEQHKRRNIQLKSSYILKKNFADIYSYLHDRIANMTVQIISVKEPAHMILILIALSSDRGLGNPVQMRSHVRMQKIWM